MKRYEQFPHTADIGIRAYGKDVKELFVNTAFAMFDVIADLEGLKTSAKCEIKAEADNYEELLVAWLDELLYNFYTKQIIFSQFDIKELSDKRLVAEASGRPVGANRNRLKTEIKAATYAGLKIEKIPEGYRVEIIFDV